MVGIANLNTFQKVNDGVLYLWLVAVRQRLSCRSCQSPFVEWEETSRAHSGLHSSRDDAS